MTFLKLNREYLMRHLFALAVLAGLGGWFAWDGFVVYPAMEGAALYESIEKSAPGEQVDLARFKAQKIATQRSFATLALLAALVVGLRLGAAAHFRFAYDDEGFVAGGTRYRYADIQAVDRRRWAKKGIVALKMSDRRTIRLDAWHHVGVDGFLEKCVSN